MIFCTHESWVYGVVTEDGEEKLKNIKMNPMTQHHEIIEVIHNVPLIHMTGIFKNIEGEDEPFSTKRMIFDSIEDLITYTKKQMVEEYSISYQTVRESVTGYEITDVVEIVQGLTAEGNTAYTIICQNGSRYIDPFYIDECELSNTRCVYKKKENIIDIALV